MIQAEITKLECCVEFVIFLVSNQNLSSAMLYFLKRDSMTIQNGMMDLNNKGFCPHPPPPQKSKQKLNDWS